MIYQNPNPYNNGPYDDPRFNPYLNNIYGYGQPQMFNGQQLAMNENALTNEEIQTLINARPNSSVLNLTISDEDVLRSMCTHHDANGRDVVQKIPRGGNEPDDLYCPICGKVWSSMDTQDTSPTKEDIMEACNVLLSYMQNVKWVGGLPAGVIREYFKMMPLIEKFPDIYEYAGKNFERLLNQRGIYTADNSSIYNQYNSLFGGYNGGYPPPYPQSVYMNPQNNGYNYMNQNPAPAGPYQPQQIINQQVPVGNPYQNPMQAPNQVPQNQPYYNQQPAGAPNYGYNPTFAVPNQQGGIIMNQPQQQVNQQPQPAQPQQQAQQEAVTASSDVKIEL